jgi:hypothetical protein
MESRTEVSASSAFYLFQNLREYVTTIYKIRESNLFLEGHHESYKRRTNRTNFSG